MCSTTTISDHGGATLIAAIHPDIIQSHILNHGGIPTDHSTDDHPADPTVICNGCDPMVHATCYGHPFMNGIPEGDWFCAQCLDSKSEKYPASKPQPSCCPCPVASGALKPTTDGRWAHLVCAIYVPEVFFVDSEAREGINCGRVLKRRWEKKCYICRSKNGCTIDCSEPKCALAFHMSCGLKEELCVEYREGKNRGAVVASFYKPHTDLWNKSKKGKFKIVAYSFELPASSLEQQAALKPHRSSDSSFQAIRLKTTLTFRDFSLVRQIGSGDIGRIYLCRLRGAADDGRLYAMKVVDNDVLELKKKTRRAETERKIMRLLDHPFLPTLFAEFKASNFSYVVSSAPAAISGFSGILFLKSRV